MMRGSFAAILSRRRLRISSTTSLVSQTMLLIVTGVLLVAMKNSRSLNAKKRNSKAGVRGSTNCEAIGDERRQPRSLQGQNSQKLF